MRHKLSLFPRQLAARREAPCLALRALRDRALHHEELLERAPLDGIGLGPREDGALVLLKGAHAVGRVRAEESARRLRNVLERLLTHKAQPRLELGRPGGGRPCPRPVRLLPGGGVLLRRLSKALRLMARLRHALPRRTEARPRHHKVDGQHEQDEGRGDRVLEQEDGHRQRLVHIHVLARRVDDLRVACVEHGDQQVDEEDEHEQAVEPQEEGRDQGAARGAGDLGRVEVAKGSPKGGEEGPRG